MVTGCENEDDVQVMHRSREDDTFKKRMYKISRKKERGKKMIRKRKIDKNYKSKENSEGEREWESNEKKQKDEGRKEKEKEEKV